MFSSHYPLCYCMFENVGLRHVSLCCRQPTPCSDQIRGRRLFMLRHLLQTITPPYLLLKVSEMFFYWKQSPEDGECFTTFYFLLPYVNNVRKKFHHFKWSQICQLFRRFCLLLFNIGRYSVLIVLPYARYCLKFWYGLYQSLSYCKFTGTNM